MRLLTHAVAAVKPGGKLIYSACTLAHAETSGIAQTFNHPDFAPLYAKSFGSMQDDAKAFYKWSALPD